MAKFKPLTLDLIEEGTLKRDLEEQLENLQRALCVYVEEHGAQAEKAVATLKLTIKIRCESVDDNAFSVTGKIDKQIPTRPARSTLAIMDHDENERPTLFAQASGTSRTDPKQGKLMTDDGRAIDPATGEVAAPKAKSA